MAFAALPEDEEPDFHTSYPPPPPDPHSDTQYASYPSDLIDSPVGSDSDRHTAQQEHDHDYDQVHSQKRARNPSLSIRSRGFSSSSSSSVKRKPLPSTASPLATRFSSGEHLAATSILPPQTFSRPYSLDSPTLYQFPSVSGKPFSPGLSGPRPVSSANEPAALTPASSSDPPRAPVKEDRIASLVKPNIGPASPSLNVPLPSRPATGSSLAKHARLVSDSSLSLASESTGPWYGDSSFSGHSRTATMSMFSNKTSPPQTLTLPPAPARSFSSESIESDTTVQRPQSKSPGASKLGSFFGWGATATPSSPTTSISDKAHSPIPSPALPRSPDVSSTGAVRAAAPTAIDIPKANADAGYFGNAYLQIPPATPASPTPIQVEEMEEELKAISSELASSIRREMDLEDLVDRLQAEASNPIGPGSKRTSDYFSDSGTSSVKYGETDTRQEELDRMQRKAEQEKAQIRLELTSKVQDERSRRKLLETQIRRLEDRASQSELASMNSHNTSGRLKELESNCEDLRRRLAEERQVKDNFEDLFTALKGELQSSSNERDNLRDEIVPQLRARVEGLEAQAAQHEQLNYEHSKMQQELQLLKKESHEQSRIQEELELLKQESYEQSKMQEELELLKKENYEQSKMQQELQFLKKENTTLINAHKLQSDMQQQMKKFNTISEEASLPRTTSRASVGLTRSNSLATRGSFASSRPPSGGLQRSGSIKVAESRDSLAERVKDVEQQRDALHAALKSLLERQDYQNREMNKRIQHLEMERDRALSSSPKRVGYDKEVSNLREEINTLRRRADEAIEQKWQCEKGLSGLKMDLDRAEQEIASLRSLLQENDILIPGTGSRPNSATRRGSNPVTSASLEQAYHDLQKAYEESLNRINSMDASIPKDTETDRAMLQLEQSLSDAISERDFAMQEAESLRQQSESLRGAEQGHVSHEMALAEELQVSAKRVEELAAQVRQQLASNSTLRQRLSETIARGEREQKDNAAKIVFMQSKLKNLEDRLMAAQQASEDTISRHEDELRGMREAHNDQLLRMKDGLLSPRQFGPKTPLTPIFTSSFKTPRIMSTSSGKALSVSEDSKVEFLKQRVLDLESALADADKEMEEVVGRMNIAQIEVMELQNEREEAVRETRRLQRQVEEEKVKAFQQKFASLSS
ncbi:hypothetical protein PVAG01_01552 [Phlyctema vagabunda]|uniref:DUF7603 domain-containing protein n=1 Tax=Phlyctema vagabunda TaxID=108571 RepID=A0ABR4PXF8_9HELO